MDTTVRKHRVKIAVQTLRMNDLFARLMGGMSKEEARETLRKEGWSNARIKSLEGGK